MGSLLEIGLAMLVFYFNYQWSIPKLLPQRKYLGYGVSIVLFFVVYYVLIHFSSLEYYIYEGSNLRNLVSIGLNYLLFTLLAFLYWNSQQTVQERERKLVAQTEKTAAEMQFLKTQISPHFIFNTLNNIYSLVQQRHDNAAPMLAKLSKILRYILYDNNRDKVLINKELEIIKEYIQLQLLRQPASQNVDFYQEGITGDLEIAPLLLLHFVENCFKHSGVDTDENAYIKIECRIEDRHLFFLTENSKRLALKQDIGGIGSTNVARQLALNYGDDYDLKIEEIEGVYKVNLVLSL